MSLFSGRAQSKLAPNAADILHKDAQLHDYMLDLVAEIARDPESKLETVALAKILATGLSEIHARLGDMWVWDKAGRG